MTSRWLLGKRGASRHAMAVVKALTSKKERERAAVGWRSHAVRGWGKKSDRGRLHAARDVKKHHQQQKVTLTF